MKVIQPRVFNPRKTLFVGTVILILIIVHIMRDPAGPTHVHWMGRTMGTHYDIKIAHSPLTLVEARRLHQEVERYLRRINDEMSTYLPDSEISRFNSSRETTPFPVSASFANVVREALHWAERTGGAFDPTLDPLINLWGFGHRAAGDTLPGNAEIEAALKETGDRDIEVVDAFHILKARPDIQLNLNAIAKGYAVDGVASLIYQAGATNLYVEIGGDVVVSGVNRDYEPWRIGVELPDAEAEYGEQLHGLARLTRGALAGSGNYRQFHVSDDVVYSHILDPRTGRPVQHTLAAVNVWAEECVTADVIATALIVMGLPEGLAWLDQTPAAEAVFFDRAPDGTIRTVYSSGFRRITAYEEMPAE